MSDFAPTAGRGRQAIALLRSGQSATTIGLAFNGLAAYIFLAAAGRSLGPTEFAPLSVLWTVVFLVGTGLFQPFDQELGRSIAARSALGQGSRALLRRVSIVAGGLFAIVAVVALAATPVLADGLFRGDNRYVPALVVGVGGVGFMFVVRGLLAGSGRYYGYAVLFLADGLTKSIPSLLYWLLGGDNAFVFALFLIGAAFIGGAVPLTRGTRFVNEGPTPAWGTICGAIGLLLLTAFLSQLLLNMGTLAVEILATDAEHDRAGVFLSGLAIARVPLFLSQAVQAVILPKLSRLVAQQDMAGFRRISTMLLSAMFGATAIATLGSALLGPLAVRLLFGEDFALLGTRDMGLLTLASLVMMCALTINQVQIALHDHRHAWWPWACGVGVFLAVVSTVSDDLFFRVELALTAGAVTVAALAGLSLRRSMRQPVPTEDDLPLL